MTGAFFCWGALLVDMAWLSCRKFVWSQNFNRLASHLPFLKVRKILYTTPQPFPYRGNELVAVKVLSSKDDKDFKYIQGIIYKFTQIRDKDWYDAQKGIPLENEEDKPNIDIKRIFPNLTVTYFCFIPQGHRFFIITKYKDFNISILYFAKTLKKLLNRDYLIEKIWRCQCLNRD